METSQVEAAVLLPCRSFVSLAGELTRGYSNRLSDPQPPDPWAPVVRWTRGSHPEHWSTVAPDPQPLPLRLSLVAALAQGAIDRPGLLCARAEAFPDGPDP